MGLNFSLGKMAEVQTEWTAYNFLSVTQASSAPIVPELSSNGKATSDFGDLRLSTKILMIPESAQTPSFGVFTSVELPNASTNKGLGLNSTQYRGGILLGKHWGQLPSISGFFVALGVFVSLLTLFWRPKSFSNYPLSLGIILICLLAPYTVLWTGGYPPRWSIHILPLSILAVTLLLDRLRWVQLLIPKDQSISAETSGKL